MKPNAKRLIMNLMAAGVDWPLTARNAVTACALFGVSESSTRVTLNRLTTEGLIEARERGVYQLTPHARKMAEDVRGFGFIRCDAIARTLGMDSQAPQRIQAALIYVLQENLQEGHLWMAFL